MRRFLLLFFICYHIILTGQDHILSNQTRFELLSIKNGMPANSAHAIVQDKEGYIWVGTFGGLSRYDGYEFKNYQQNKAHPNIPVTDNLVMSLYIDKSDHIWLGTMLNGLQRFDPKTETIISYPAGGSGEVDTYVNKITEDQQGNIWVGTINGLFKLSSPNGTFENDDVIVQHFSAKAYPESLLSDLSKATHTEALLAGIQQVEDNFKDYQSFSLSRRTKLVIVGTGEYGGINSGMLDYGWVSDVEGKVVWTMDYGNTFTATSIYNRGDHPCNRRVVEILELEAGEYKLHYQSNEKHHYKNWDLTKVPEPFSRKKGIIPTFPELWGIHIYNFEAADFNAIKNQLAEGLKAPLVSGSSVNDLYIDKEEQLWIASAGGVDRLDTKATDTTIEPLHKEYGNQLKFQTDFASSIYEKKDGTIWFCGHQLNHQQQKYEFVLEALNTARRDTSVTQVFHSNSFNHDTNILEDSIGNIWLSAYFNGLHQLVHKVDNEEEYQAIKYPFVTPNARHLFVDQFNVLWVGVWQEGIYKLNPSAAPFKFTELPKLQNSEKSHVTAIVEDKDGIIFLGTSDGGVLKWDQENGDLTELNLTIDNEVVSLAIDKDRQLWIGVNRTGIMVYDLIKDVYLPNYPAKKEELQSSNFKSISIDINNNKWISTDEGVFGYFPPSNEIVFYRTLSDILIDGAFDMQVNEQTAELFISNNQHGLQVIDLKKHQLNPEEPSVNSYFPDTTFLNIAIDPNTEHIWISSNKGLFLIHKDTKELIPFKNDQQFKDLPDIFHILPDNSGNLWLSMPIGIGKYTIATGEFNLFDANNGIYLNEHRAGPSLLTKSGEVVIGGKNGFYHFRPDDITIGSIPPEVQITRIATAPNSSREDSTQLVITSPKESIKLSPTQNTFEINYVGLHFDKSQQKNYAYRMIGLNDNWIPVGKERNARFNSLSPGNYTFQVKASNGDGIWNEIGTSIDIKVLPPWWKTYWAYVLYTLLSIATIILIYFNQVRRIRLKNRLDYEQKEAERLVELDRLKTNFFSNITHEFRTPLTLIIEPARQLLEKLKGHDLESNVQLINQNSQHLLGLVNQLLDLSKLEGGKMLVELRRSNIYNVVSPIVDSFIPAAKLKGIEIDIDNNTSFTHHYFDVRKLEKVIYNLLSNALKFTEKGFIKLIISQTDQPSPLFHISVQDSGVGIDSQKTSFIFDRFYQADSPTTGKVPGTGIGLSLVKELVELMDGTIEVNSLLKQGSIFKVSLPLIFEATEKSVNGAIAPTQWPVLIPPANHTSIKDQKTAPTTTDKPLLLIIEDNENLRNFLAKSLRPTYDILEAENGAIGTDIAKEAIPDLVITDLMMPIKNGFEVCDTLKKEILTAHIPIILLTAKTSMDSKLKGLKLGADAYLTKPFHTEELLVRIKKLIELRRKLQTKYSSMDLTQLHVPSPQKNNTLSSPKKTEPKAFKQLDQQFLERFITLIVNNIQEDQLSIDSVSKQLFISRSQLHRKIKALTGDSPSVFIRNYRLDYSLELLKKEPVKIRQVANEVGFSDEKYFSRRFKERFGYSPSEVNIQNRY